MGRGLPGEVLAAAEADLQPDVLDVAEQACGSWSAPVPGSTRKVGSRLSISPAWRALSAGPWRRP
jgi:hypothetical protein